MHNQKFSVSPCYYVKRGYGQCDYTKKFLKDSDKNQREIQDDGKEIPGLEIIPEDISKEELAVATRAIKDPDMLKRIIRYQILSRDE